MMNIRICKRTVFFCLFVMLLPFSGDAFSQDCAQQYARTVAQLRKEGFSGIDKALASFERIIRDNPGFTKAYVSAADALLVKYEFSKNRKKQWMQEALRYLNAAVDKAPGTAQYYFKRAIVYFNLEKPSKAETDLKKAIALKARFLKAQVLYLQYLLSTERRSEARQLADEWLRGYGADPAPLKYFGDLFFEAGAYKDALFYYRQVVARVDKAPNTHAAMGEAYWKLGETEKAIAAFKKALVQDPKMYRVHFALGTCLGESGDAKEAITHFQRYLEKFSDDAAALNNLALLYEREGQKAQARLAWMRLKSKTREKVYLQRAEEHLYRLAYDSGLQQKKTDNKKRSKKNAKGDKRDE